MSALRRTGNQIQAHDGGNIIALMSWTERDADTQIEFLETSFASPWTLAQMAAAFRKQYASEKPIRFQISSENPAMLRFAALIGAREETRTYCMEAGDMRTKRQIRKEIS